MKQEHNIRQTAATIESLLGLVYGEEEALPHEKVMEGAKWFFKGEACDRVFFYNPDAIAMWLYRRYQTRFEDLEEDIQLRMQIRAVFPPYTQACFASMYSGQEPRDHGVWRDRRAVLRGDTVFDRLIRAGKRPALIAREGDAMSRLFSGREMDYYLCDTVGECNEKALDLIGEDKYDFLALYNGNYDRQMRRFGPEGEPSIKALDENIDTFRKIYDKIKERWKKHNTVLAFAPDHGCHKSLLFLGNHGADKPSDMETVHFYSFLPRGQEGPGKEI